MFRAVGIPDPERRYATYPHELSGGMAQRVVISIGLICDPTLILADEPTFGLDVTIQAQVLALMREQVTQHAGRAMILVTRDLGIVAHFCDWIYVIQEGQLVASQPVLEFFESPQSEAAQRLLGASKLAHGSSSDLSVAARPE
jgi:ABC-type dipeptide/oligopeptide/nickel transport system ATPase component